jgi:FG-GAP-like repeat
MGLRSLVCAAVLGTSTFAQGWLASPRVYDFTNAELVAIGDEDGDGDQDLIRFGNAGGFRVMWNDGLGQLTAGPITPTAPVGSSQTVYRDFTGDGQRDVAYPDFATVVIRPGLGGGLFGAPITVPFPGNVWWLATGDADGDGPDDIAVVYYDPAFQHVAWIVSNAGVYTVNAGGALGLYQVVDALVVLDFSADGVDDIAVNLSGTVRLMPTVAATPTMGATFAGPSGVGTHLCAADFDADGDRDLVAASWSPGLSLAKLTNTNGTFTLGVTQFFPTPTIFGDFEAADMNGDGAADLLFRGHEFLSSPYGVLSNDGTGSFTLEFLGYLYAAGQFGGAGFADLNGDGNPDFVGPCEIHFGDGTFADPFGTTGPDTRHERDWDEDGDLDYYASNEGIWKNDGRGFFTITPVTPPPPPPNTIYGMPPAVDDFDGDGVFDYPAALFTVAPPFQSTFIEMRLLHGNGDGSMTDTGVAGAPGLNFGGAWRWTDDIDGDGDKDIVGPAGTFVNVGTGFFTQPQHPFPGWDPIAMRDVDGDGDQDFLGAPWPASPYLMGAAILRRTSPGTYAVEVLLAPGSGGFAGQPSFADVDGDGDQDVAIENQSGNSIHVWTNSGGTFSGPTPIVIPGPHNSPSVAAADMDADGLVDLVLATANRIHIHRCLGPGQYEPPRTYIGFNSGVRTVDLDNDGDPDVLTGSVIRNRRFHGAAGGFTRQYGLGSPGSGGFRPVLGLAGPTRPGSIEHLHLTRCVGGGPVLLVAAALEVNIPNFGYPGLTAYVAAYLEFLPFTLPGAPGAPGVGELHIPFGPVPPSVAGLHLYLQAAIADPGTPSGLSHTNGLEVQQGL